MISLSHHEKIWGKLVVLSYQGSQINNLLTSDLEVCKCVLWAVVKSLFSSLSLSPSSLSQSHNNKHTHLCTLMCQSRHLARTLIEGQTLYCVATDWVTEVKYYLRAAQQPPTLYPPSETHYWHHQCTWPLTPSPLTWHHAQMPPLWFHPSDAKSNLPTEHHAGSVTCNLLANFSQKLTLYCVSAGFMSNITCT